MSEVKDQIVQEYTHKGSDGRPYLTRKVNGVVEYSLPIEYIGWKERNEKGQERLICGYRVIH